MLSPHNCRNKPNHLKFLPKRSQSINYIKHILNLICDPISINHVYSNNTARTINPAGCIVKNTQYPTSGYTRTIVPITDHTLIFCAHIERILGDYLCTTVSQISSVDTAVPSTHWIVNINIRFVFLYPIEDILNLDPVPFSNLMVARTSIVSERGRILCSSMPSITVHFSTRSFHYFSLIILKSRYFIRV